MEGGEEGGGVWEGFDDEGPGGGRHGVEGVGDMRRLQLHVRWHRKAPTLRSHLKWCCPVSIPDPHPVDHLPYIGG